ncbi:DUF3408 domain-containing protein [Phocaeicola vulgatus]|nr:DUF3408 domain-containing protein [Phocaeicola vulgatus]
MTVRRTACKQERVRETLPVQRSVQPTKVWERPVMFPERERGSKPIAAFLQSSEIKTRQCIYISREVHEKVAIVANRLGNGLSIGKFVDNVLRDHFRQYGEKYMEQIENAKKVRL